MERVMSVIEEEFDEDEFMNLVNHISSKVPPFTATILINGKEVKMELDTGCPVSPVTILNQSTAHEVLGKCKLNPSNID